MVLAVTQPRNTARLYNSFCRPCGMGTSVRLPAVISRGFQICNFSSHLAHRAEYHIMPHPRQNHATAV